MSFLKIIAVMIKPITAVIFSFTKAPKVISKIPKSIVVGCKPGLISTANISLTVESLGKSLENALPINAPNKVPIIINKIKYVRFLDIFKRVKTSSF
ncbi:MAG: hypothetical protein N2505_02520 [Endomicrobia bacterium]|nr:hypothetical protein [Endomicrobiia bacterium]